MDWVDVVILLSILLFVTPFAQLSVAAARRRRARGQCERERGTRVLSLVLGMDPIATYGLPVVRFETLPLPAELADAVAATPPGTPIDLLVDTPAGLAFDAQALVEALARHGAQTTLFVPRRALTAGLELAHAVDRVVLGTEAVVGDGREAPLHADELRAQGVRVEEGVPDCIAGYLGAFREPRRPRFALPFYVALPRRSST
jgi:hypothetical protein